MRWIEPAASGFIRFRRIYLVTSLQVINCNSRISFRKINWMSNMPARYAVHENKQRTFDEKCGISMTKFFEKPFHIWIHVVASSTESKCSDSIFKWFGLVFIGAGHLSRNVVCLCKSEKFSTKIAGSVISSWASYSNFSISANFTSKPESIFVQCVTT